MRSSAIVEASESDIAVVDAESVSVSAMFVDEKTSTKYGVAAKMETLLRVDEALLLGPQVVESQFQSETASDVIVSKHSLRRL